MSVNLLPQSHTRGTRQKPSEWCPAFPKAGSPRTKPVPAIRLHRSFHFHREAYWTLPTGMPGKPTGSCAADLVCPVTGAATAPTRRTSFLTTASHHIERSLSTIGCACAYIERESQMQHGFLACAGSHRLVKIQEYIPCNRLDLWWIRNWLQAFPSFGSPQLSAWHLCSP